MKRKLFVNVCATVCLLFGTIHIRATTADLTIGILGTGYVGLSLGACLAEFGHTVICADIDKQKIAMLKSGSIPIYEPGLKEMVVKYTKNGNLTFTDNPQDTICRSNVIFIAVQTPTNENGKADLSAVKSVARTIGENLNGYKIICTKSTVPIGTAQEIKHIIKNFSQGIQEFDIVSNPEFLREGSAINDFLYPDRVVIGYESKKALSIMQEIYRPLSERNVPFVYADLASSETIKYACNAFLASKISFINEIANLCEEIGADIQTVAQGMGSDKRIGQHFLCPGPGFGGSCFPKDIQALINIGQSSSLDLKVVGAALEANNAQKMRVVEKIKRLADYDLHNTTIAILGLAFKANTDDIRYSPAITVIENLLTAGAHIKVYDPEAMNNMKKIIPEIEYCDHLYNAVSGADITVVLTEWAEFQTMDLEKVASLVKHRILLDTRNILDVHELRRLGFTFENTGNASMSSLAVKDNQ